MAKSAKDYPVTQPYGYDPSYMGNPQHFHYGVDYGAGEGTPIVVNGVQIGLVGHTGHVYDQEGKNSIHAAHLHVGKWGSNGSSNPGKNGFSFKKAVVTQVAQDATNGKYVRVQADGYSWVYLHMSKQTAKVGQVLKPSTPPKPKPAYPKVVRVVSKGGAYVRRKPTTAASTAGSRYLPYGTPFRVKGAVKGQKVAGVDKWYVTMYGNYVWAQNVK